MDNKVDIRRYRGEETKETLIEKLNLISTESVLVVTIDDDFISHGWAGLNELEALGVLEVVKNQILMEMEER